jgi:hypothetical protein
MIGESTMIAATASEIARLETTTITKVVERFESLFGEKCRSRNKRYLIRRIAWRLQANAEDGRSERVMKRAAELVRDSTCNSSPLPTTIVLLAKLLMKVYEWSVVSEIPLLHGCNVLTSDRTFRITKVGGRPNGHRLVVLHQPDVCHSQDRLELSFIELTTRFDGFDFQTRTIKGCVIIFAG